MAISLQANPAYCYEPYSEPGVEPVRWVCDICNTIAEGKHCRDSETWVCNSCMDNLGDDTTPEEAYIEHLCSENLALESKLAKALDLIRRIQNA